VLKIKPEIWTRSGGEQFVVLSMDDFEKVQELIEDVGLSRILREAKRRNAHSPTRTLEEVKRSLGLSRRSRAVSKPGA
jgi:PHD/YefM family antitoxin component YafN of YafNO toxin-antitoxin module